MKTIDGYDVKIFTDNIEENALGYNVDAERLDMMRRRQAYFAAVAEEYDAFDEFIKSQGMWLAIMGIQLTRSEEYIGPQKNIYPIGVWLEYLWNPLGVFARFLLDIEDDDPYQLAIAIADLYRKERWGEFCELSKMYLSKNT